MRIVVLGATGRTGRHVVEQALGHGHGVVAAVHATPLSLSHPRLEQASVDVLDFESVSAVVEGADAVASALGVGARQSPHLHEQGVANAIHAMALHDVRKLAAVSAAGAFARGSRDLSIGFRTLIATTLRSVYDDLEAMESRIMASDLDWTIVRPYGLSDGEQTGGYRMTKDGSLLAKGARISRADVAAVLLSALETREYERRILTVSQ